jgi:hypothetical protein
MIARASLGTGASGAVIYLLGWLACRRIAPAASGEWARSGLVVLLFVWIFVGLNKPRAAAAGAVFLLLAAVFWVWSGRRRALRKS